MGQGSDTPTQIQFNAKGSKLYSLTQGKLLQAMNFDLVNRKCSTNDVISDMAIQDFKVTF